MLVKELMKRPFIVDKDVSLAEAARLMSENDIGSLMFVSGDKLKGIITERDLVKNFSSYGKISEAMTKKLVTVDPEETLDRATEIMRTKKVKRLPVVDDGKLVGIITITDIIANFESLEEDFFFE